MLETTTPGIFRAEEFTCTLLAMEGSQGSCREESLPSEIAMPLIFPLKLLQVTLLKSLKAHVVFIFLVFAMYW